MVITNIKDVSAGAEWPIKGEQSRLDTYATNALLFDGRHMAVWPDLNGNNINVKSDSSFNLMEKLINKEITIGENYTETINAQIVYRESC